MPGALAEVHRATRTPVSATVAVALTVLGLALWSLLETLARTNSVLLLLVFASVNLAPLRIRRRGPPPEGALRFPAIVPAARLAFSLGLVVVQAVEIAQG